MATKKSAFADLVDSTSSLNGWIDNLGTTLLQNQNFVKGVFNLGVDLPGVEPGELGLSIQPSEPAKPTLGTLSQVLSSLVNHEATQSSSLASLQIALDQTGNLVATQSGILALQGESLRSYDARILALEDKYASLSAQLATASATPTATTTPIGCTSTVGSPDGCAGSGGSSISTLSGPLHLQETALANLEIMAGQIIIDTKGNLTISGTITAKKYNIDIAEPRTATASAGLPAIAGASAGKAEIPSGQTELEIQTTSLTPNSLIFVTPENLPVAVSAAPSEVLTKEGLPLSFTIKLKEAQTQPLKVSWWIVN